jgi:hypothetical protein
MRSGPGWTRRVGEAMPTVSITDDGSRRFGIAWVALTLSLAAHVVDEAATGFLAVYNPIVESLRLRLGWFPMPVFTFPVWLGGLCAAVIALLALSPLAFRGARITGVLVYPYAAFMLLNGLGHLAGSVYLRRWAPGATTAPLLIATSIWLWRSASRRRIVAL